MRQNVIQLEKFYAAGLGQAALAMTRRRLEAVWPRLTGRDMLAFGYANPYISPYLDDAKRIILAMPGAQGAIAQSSRRGQISCLVQEDLLPFSDAQFDNVLVAHGLEEAEALQTLLSELWRVTKPEGRIVIIAANRSGLWARSEKTPFGAGRPFTRTQLRGLLRVAGFEPVLWSGALYAPPLKPLAGPMMLNAFERFGETVWPTFSGLVLVEAIKRLYAEPSGRHAQKASRPIFGTAPIGTSAPRR